MADNNNSQQEKKLEKRLKQYRQQAEQYLVNREPSTQIGQEIREEGIHKEVLNKQKKLREENNEETKPGDREVKGTNQYADRLLDTADEQEEQNQNQEQNEETEDQEQEEKKGGFWFVLPYSIFLDIADLIAGIFVETLIEPIIRMMIEPILSGVIIAWYRWKYRSFSNAKGKRNMIKYIISAALDWIPLINYLPLETMVLSGLWLDEKTGGKIESAVEKTTGKTEDQKSNTKNNQLQNATT